MLQLSFRAASPILSAPGWVRKGITAPTERLREEAALELAKIMLNDDVAAAGITADQLMLAL